MNNNAGKFHITVCTLVYPYLDKGVGRFVEWYKTDATEEFRGITSFIKAKLSENYAKRLGFPYIHHIGRTEVNLGSYPEKLLQSNQDFVRFGIEEDNPHSFWEFVITPSKLEEIWSNSQAGAYIQLFDLTFYEDIQRDHSISISKCEELRTGLVFESKCVVAMGLGFIENHRSMTLADYEAITGKDPVMLQARQHYYDPVMHDFFISEQKPFDEYLKRIRSHFGQA